MVVPRVEAGPDDLGRARLSGPGGKAWPWLLGAKQSWLAANKKKKKKKK